MRGFVAALMAVAVTVAPAFAQTDVAAFEKLGLAGRWANDCSKPASDKNYIDTWTLADGNVELVSAGREKPNQVKIIAFGLSKDGKAFYQVSNGGGTLVIELLVEPARYRVWSSEEVIPFAGSTVYLDKGKYGDGRDTPWYNKCGD